MHEVEEFEEGRLLEMDLLWLCATEVESACFGLLSLFDDSSTVVHLLMMAEKHMPKEALSLHTELAVDSHFLLSTSSDRQYPVSQFEEKHVCVVSDDCYLFVGPAFC